MLVSDTFTLEDKWVAIGNRRGRVPCPVSINGYGDPLLFATKEEAAAVGTPLAATYVFKVIDRFDTYNYKLTRELVSIDYASEASVKERIEKHISHIRERRRMLLSDLASKDEALLKLEAMLKTLE